MRDVLLKEQEISIISIISCMLNRKKPIIRVIPKRMSISTFIMNIIVCDCKDMNIILLLGMRFVRTLIVIVYVS